MNPEPAKPRIAITSGDPAGIGPEIAARAAADPRVHDVCEPLIYGAGKRFESGKLSAAAGQAAYESILRAVRDAKAGGVQAIATAPINKEALVLAGLPWRGHTDMLDALTNTRVEMRQIGVRDEAKMLGGYGTCGRPLCCTTFLNSFEPVSIKMAKQQDLSLNPSKLSGLCGRLKCCLRYELPNAKGVVHGGCGSEGGCDNPSGCGAGGCGACGSNGCGACH